MEDLSGQADTRTRASLEIRVFGAMEVAVEGDTLPLRSFAQRALLVLLASRADTVVSTQWLVDQLWESMPQASARNNLHVQLSQLRKALTSAGWDGLIRTERNGYRLCTDAGAVDAVRFDRLVAAAREQTASGQHTGVVASAREALALWRGEPFEDLLTVAECLHQAKRLHGLRADAVEMLFEAELVMGRGANLVAEVEHYLQLYPDRERLWAQLMQVLARAGRPTEAVATYDRLRARLRARAGVEPSDDTQQIIIGIRNGAVRVEPPVGPRRGMAATLPVSPDPLIGRAGDVTVISRLLVVDHTGLPVSRVVTLTGPGGIGKTRLAIAVAEREAGQFAGGAVFVPLAAIETARGLLLAIGQALGRGNAPVTNAQELANLIKDDRVLLVLDNVEQIVDPVADLIARTLAIGRGPAFLVTSRIRLQLSAEIEHPVAPLAVREPSDALDARRSPSARLFDARSTRFVDPGQWTGRDQDAVEQICARVGGLPLAIELAAGMTRLLAPAQILEHVRVQGVLVTTDRDVPERHRSLMSIIRWGYDLLETQSRTLFVSLSIFAGTFDLAAVCHVCDVDGATAVRVIGDLVDHSVLRAEGGTAGRRYRVLAVLRQFGAQQLDPAATAALRRRHAVHFAERVSSALVETTPSVDPLRNPRIGEDLENYRLAMAFAQEVDDVRLAAELAIGLQSYFFDAAMAAEGRLWFDWVLARRERLSPLLRCILMIRAADIYDVTTERGLVWVTAARSELAELDEPLWLARCETTLGWAYMMRDDPVAAERIMRSALAGARAAG